MLLMSRPLLAGAIVLLLLPWGARPARAQPFNVFCVRNNDGTTTCEGWNGGETLTCVGSRGAVSSCSTPSGRTFTCILGAGGVSSCSNPSKSGSNRQDGNNTNCTFTGSGNLVCKPPPKRSQPLLPGPSLPPLQDNLLMPSPDPLIDTPSVFDP